MYDELVKQCRDCIDCLCGECKYEHLQKPGNFVQCMNALLGEAADAIEGLLSERDEVNADSWKTAFEVERDEHRWIPVTERLPSEDGFTLIFTANGNPGVCYFTNGWWGGYSKNHITHWMPLPEPPKEES